MNMTEFKALKTQAVADPDMDNDGVPPVMAVFRDDELIATLFGGAFMESRVLYALSGYFAGAFEAHRLDIFNDAYHVKSESPSIPANITGTLTEAFEQGHPAVVEALVRTSVTFTGRARMEAHAYHVSGSSVIWEERTDHDDSKEGESLRGRIADVVLQGITQSGPQLARQIPVELEEGMRKAGLSARHRRLVKDATAISALATQLPELEIIYSGTRTNEENELVQRTMTDMGNHFAEL